MQVKELSFSFGIAAHDLTTKLKQVESWVEKKHHVRMTLRAGRGGPDVNLVRRSTHIFSFITYRGGKEMTVCCQHLVLDTYSQFFYVETLNEVTQSGEYELCNKIWLITEIL